MEWIQPVCQINHIMEQSDFIFCKLTDCEVMVLSLESMRITSDSSSALWTAKRSGRGIFESGL